MNITYIVYKTMSCIKYITKIIRKGNLPNINIYNNTVPFMGLNVNPIITNKCNMNDNIYNEAPLCISDLLYDKNEVIDKLICYRRYPEILRLDSSNQWRLFENLHNIKNGYNGDLENRPNYYTDVSIVEIDCTLCRSSHYLEWLLMNSKKYKKNRLGIRISGKMFDLKNKNITDKFIKAISYVDFINVVGDKHELYKIKKHMIDKPIISTNNEESIETLLRYGASLVNVVKK